MRVAYSEAQKGTNTNIIANTNSMFCKCTGQSRRLSHVCLLVCARGEVCTLPGSWNIQYHRKYLCSYFFQYLYLYLCMNLEQVLIRPWMQNKDVLECVNVYEFVYAYAYVLHN